MGVATERRAEPRHDVVSALATAAPDGDQLSDAELAMFLVQLLVAGNETTRNLLSGGLAALAERPDEWDRLRADRSLVPSAVEELLRWTTPVISFLRTATRDTELRGQADRRRRTGAAGLRLGQSGRGGLRPHRRPARRRPGSQPAGRASASARTSASGAALARLEARVVLEELLDRFAAVRPAGPIERAPSSVIAGVRRAPLAFTAA